MVYLSGRSLDGQEPKYLHLPGEIRYLYNEDALSSKTVYIAEGIPDCLSAVQAGYPAVAILGSSNFKPEYLSKFSRCEVVYLCLDGDKTGEEGLSGLEDLSGSGQGSFSFPQGLTLTIISRTTAKRILKALLPPPRTSSNTN